MKPVVAVAQRPGTTGPREPTTTMPPQRLPKVGERCAGARRERWVVGCFSPTSGRRSRALGTTGIRWFTLHRSAVPLHHRLPSQPPPGAMPRSPRSLRRTLGKPSPPENVELRVTAAVRGDITQHQNAGGGDGFPLTLDPLPRGDRGALTSGVGRGKGAGPRDGVGMAEDAMTASVHRVPWHAKSLSLSSPQIGMLLRCPSGRGPGVRGRPNAPPQRLRAYCTSPYHLFAWITSFSPFR